MDPRRWARICEIFEAARDLSGPARDAVVASAPDVADDVRELLDQHEAPGELLVPPTSDPAIGEQVGPYRIERLLGRGGMAIVYLASGPDGPVALKRLNPLLLREPEVHERFRREAALGARLRHPHVVRTLGVEGEDCLVMEYIEGQTLRDLARERGALPEATCRRIGREIASGLAAIHALGTVHRDLKPANVIAASQGPLKVMDLGIALSLDDMLRLSRTGEFVGTARYSAPEQLDPARAAVDARTDLYALGLVLYELAAGRHPIPEGGLVTTMRAQLESTPEMLGRVNANVSPFFEALVGALMAKRPEDRPADAEAVIEAFDRGASSAWWRARRG